MPWNILSKDCFMDDSTHTLPALSCIFTTLAVLCALEDAFGHGPLPLLSRIWATIEYWTPRTPPTSALQAVGAMSECCQKLHLAVSFLCICNSARKHEIWSTAFCKGHNWSQHKARRHNKDNNNNKQGQCKAKDNTRQRARQGKDKARTMWQNGAIQKIMCQIQTIGGAVIFEKSNQTHHVSLKAMKHHAKTWKAYDKLLMAPQISFLRYLGQERQKLHKSLYAERAKEIMSRAKQSDKRQIFMGLNGLTKKMIQSSNFVPLPFAINDLDDSDKLLQRENISPDSMIIPRIPSLPKPWLLTKSVVEVKQRILKDKFQWPKKATLADFCALMRRGNHTPSPGPDRWEKWTLKALSDDALSLILDLHNYEVMHSCFPGKIKDLWLTTIYKKGLRTDLWSWRGLCFSNFLANSPMTWLSQCLIKYEKHILPDTQVAAQPGVQTRNLMSYLAGVKCWATQRKQPVYAIKRDQMKGFDYLSPDGFYDVIHAYGLPSEIIDIDRAAQHEVKCFIQTAYGATIPITISGVSKQGGPILPLKSTFTTSMGHYYLCDKLEANKDALIITSSKSLQRNTPTMERFQYAYGWLTNWTKSNAYILAPMPVSTAHRVDPMVATKHSVILIKDDMDFLRAKVNNPTARFNELKQFIDDFQFPTVIGRLPITIIRKLVAQNIVSKCQALLSLQPIMPPDASEEHTGRMDNSSEVNGRDLAVAETNRSVRINSRHRQWIIDRDGNIKIDIRKRDIDSRWTQAAKTNWTKFTNMLDKYLSMDDLTRGMPDLAIPRDVHEQRAQCYIQGLARTSGLPGSTYTDSKTWATDGSMLPASAGPLDPKTITGAATGTLSLVMRVPGRNVSILHGEQLALIIALLVAGCSDEHQTTNRILTDHLSSVRLIDDSQSNISQVPRLRFMNGRHFHGNINITYTPGHSNDRSTEACMNSEADHLASALQKCFKDLPEAPPPTFHMNKFTFHHPTDGWIESNITQYIGMHMERLSENRLRQTHGQRIPTWGHDSNPPPEYPYIKAASAHSAAIQLYMRSGQLAMADILKKRNLINDDQCRLRCAATESPRHIFLKCPQYKTWRTKTKDEVVRKTELKVETMEIRGPTKENLIRAAKSLFVDDELVWPLHVSLYYLGSANGDNSADAKDNADQDDNANAKPNCHKDCAALDAALQAAEEDEQEITAADVLAAWAALGSESDDHHSQGTMDVDQDPKDTAAQAAQLLLHDDSDSDKALDNNDPLISNAATTAMVAAAWQSDSNNDANVKEVDPVPPDDNSNAALTLGLGIGTGNPGVFQSYLYPNPRKPIPAHMGTGFVGDHIIIVGSRAETTRDASQMHCKTSSDVAVIIGEGGGGPHLVGEEVWCGGVHIVQRWRWKIPLVGETRGAHIPLEWEGHETVAMMAPGWIGGGRCVALFAPSKGGGGKYQSLAKLEVVVGVPAALCKRGFRVVATHLMGLPLCAPPLGARLVLRGGEVVAAAAMMRERGEPS
ncbi:hypothetical protein B0H34DRAFT_670556 [Crassisporium funariophilum]|nr:hypothetical protein B0H34DRAFT_670556 [Crassisporium funariophilum]